MEGGLKGLGGHMRKKLFIITAIAVAVIAVGVSCWFYAPGMHLLGPFGHIDLTKECYLFDSEGQEDGTIVISIRGYVRWEFPDFQQGAFAGVITIDDGDGNEDDRNIYRHTFYRQDDGSYYMLYLENRVTYDEAQQRLKPSFDGNWYQVYLDADGDFALVACEEQEELREYRFAAICAAGQEAAGASYGRMKEAGMIPMR